jgi:phage tail-like protein
MTTTDRRASSAAGYSSGQDSQSAQRGGPATGKMVHPTTTHNFSFQRGKIEEAYFNEVSGLTAEVDVFSYEEGGENDYVRKLPGRAKFSNVTLKRGVVYNEGLWLWFRDVSRGKIVRADVSVVLYDTTHDELKRWNLAKAYPVKWVGPSFKADENAVSVESLELAFEGMSVSSKLREGG